MNFSATRPRTVTFVAPVPDYRAFGASPASLGRRAAWRCRSVRPVVEEEFAGRELADASDPGQQTVVVVHVVRPQAERPATLALAATAPSIVIPDATQAEPDWEKSAVMSRAERIAPGSPTKVLPAGRRPPA